MWKYSPLKTEKLYLDEDRGFDYDSPFQFKDSELNFKSIFTYTKPVREKTSQVSYGSRDDQGFIDRICTGTLVFLSYLLFLFTVPVSAWFCIKTLADHERALVFRLGRVHSIKGPGRILLLPCIENWKKTDIRIRAFNIPPQQMILSDRAIVELGADVQYRVVDVPQSILHIKNLEDSYRIISRSVFVNNVSKRTLPQLQHERLVVGTELLMKFNEVTLDWGVQIERVDISDIKILKASEPTSITSLTKVLNAIQNQSSGLLQNLLQKDMLQSVTEDCVAHKSNSAEKLSEILSITSRMGFLKGIDAKVTLEILGSTDEKFHIIFLNDEHYLSFENDTTPSDVILRINETDFGRILEQEITPLEAYISGKLSVEGDLQLLMKLQNAMQMIPKDGIKSTIINI